RSGVASSEFNGAPPSHRGASRSPIPLFRPRSCSSTTVGGRSWGHVAGRSRAGRIGTRQQKAICRPFRKPSDGLEPSTPSLPSSTAAGTGGRGGGGGEERGKKKKESLEHG